MSEILDSGERREFSSGAVRDMSEGKGRMDLMPLDIVSELCNKYEEYRKLRSLPTFNASYMFGSIDDFAQTGDVDRIYYLLSSFICYGYADIETALLDVSIHYEQGAKKYVERNWEKGIDAHSFIDSALRHGIKVLRGDDDEPHGRAFIWNLLGVLWIIEHKPEFNDLPYIKSELNSETRKEYIK